MATTQTQTLGLRTDDILKWEATPLTRITLRMKRDDPAVAGQITSHYGARVRTGDVLTNNSFYEQLQAAKIYNALLFIALTDEDDQGRVAVQTRNCVISLDYLTLSRYAWQTGDGSVSVIDASSNLASQLDNRGIHCVGCMRDE